MTGRVLLVQAEAGRLPLRDGCVQTCVTSVPYFALRRYEGVPMDLDPGAAAVPDCLGWARGADCAACYVCKLRGIFREVWRVMRPDATLWLNSGDTYNSNPSWGRGHSTLQGRPQDQMPAKPAERWLDHKRTSALKPKDLCGMPWHVALALQADGWYLRSEIIWAKPNPMPESITDRPTKAHEQVFLFTKAARYYYDAEAVREAHQEPWRSQPRDMYQEAHGPKDRVGTAQIFAVTSHREYNAAGRNARTVWDIPTEPTAAAHFATYPQALVRRCLLAGTSAHGCCSACGSPWRRVVERQTGIPASHNGSRFDRGKTLQAREHLAAVGTGERTTGTHTTGWAPTCRCDAPVSRCLVLDPFVGSGTSLLVARELGLNAVGTDLSLPYLRDIARPRLDLDRLAAWEGRNGHTKVVDYTALPLFGGGA